LKRFNFSIRECNYLGYAFVYIYLIWTSIDDGHLSNSFCNC